MASMGKVRKGSYKKPAMSEAKSGAMSEARGRGC